MKKNCEGCQFYERGKCQKFIKDGRCNPSSAADLEKGFAVCDVTRMCENGSEYGNRYCGITDEDIEKLKNGDILYFVDEYGYFLGYVGAE